MYASVRSVTRAGIVKGENAVHKNVKHNNKGNKRGKKYYVQTVVNKSGKAVKTIVHIVSYASDAWKPRRKKVRLRRSMERQPR